MLDQTVLIYVTIAAVLAWVITTGVAFLYLRETINKLRRDRRHKSKGGP